MATEMITIAFFRLFETSHAKQSVRAAADSVVVVVVVDAVQSCFVVTLKGHRCWKPTSGTQRMI